MEMTPANWLGIPMTSAASLVTARSLASACTKIRHTADQSNSCVEPKNAKNYNQCGGGGLLQVFKKKRGCITKVIYLFKKTSAIIINEDFHGSTGAADIISASTGSRRSSIFFFNPVELLVKKKKMPHLEVVP